MKNLISGLAALVVFMATVGVSFGDEAKFSLSVKDRVEKSSESTEEDNENQNNGDIDTVETDVDTEICTLTVKVKMSGEPSRDCQLEWGFISKRSDSRKIGDEEERVHCTGKKEISLKNAVTLEDVIVSDPFVFTTIERNNNQRWSGDVYAGHVILLTSNGEIVAMDSSSKKYAKEEWIDKVRNPPAKPKGKNK